MPKLTIQAQMEMTLTAWLFSYQSDPPDIPLGDTKPLHQAEKKIDYVFISIEIFRTEALNAI